WLPDTRDVFLPEAMSDLSFTVETGLDGKGILVQACQQCHNGQFDTTLSRSNFDVTKLDTMLLSEKQTAVSRMHLPDTDPKKMPPVRFRQLTAAEIALASTVLAN